MPYEQRASCSRLQLPYAAHLLDYFAEAERQAFLDTWTQPEWTIAGERFYHLGCTMGAHIFTRAIISSAIDHQISSYIGSRSRVADSKRHHL